MATSARIKKSDSKAKSSSLKGGSAPASSSVKTVTSPNAGEENSAYLLRQVAERLGISLVHALRPFDQMPSVYRVLIALTRKNPVRMRDLIDLTLIESSVLSRTVTRMKEQGLLRVESDDEDGRAVVIHATDAGHALLGSMLPAVSAQFNWAIHDVPADDLEVLRRTLQRMLHNLRISPIK